MISSFKDNKFNIFKVIYLIPIFLITGPFLADLTVSLCVIFFLYYFFKYEKSYFKNNFFIFFAIIYLYLLLCTIFSTNFIFSLKSTLPYFRFFIFCLATVYLIEKKILVIETLYKIIFLIFFIIFLDSIFQFATGENIFGFKSPLHYRITSFFGDEAILGSYTFKFLMLFLFLNNLVNYKYKNHLFFLGIFMSSIIIILSGDRAPLVFLIICMLFLLFMDFKKIYPLFIIFILSFSIFIFNSDTLKKRIVHMTFQGFYKTLGNFDSQKFEEKKNLEFIQQEKPKFFISQSHHHHIIAALKIFKDHRLIGSGPNTFRVICYDEKNNYKEFSNSCSSHPHNFYIQLLSETGIILPILFLIIFLIVVYKIFFLLIKKNGNISNEYLILLNVFIILFPLSPNGNFFNNWLNIINFFPFGFYLSYYKNYLISK